MSVIMDKMKQAIQEDDRQAVLEVLTNISTVDPSFSSGTFDEALQYAEANFGKEKLYAKYDGGELYKGNTDKADYGNAVIDMENNFCKERIDATRAFGQRLYGQVGGNNDAKKASSPQGPERPKEEKSNFAMLVSIILLLILGVGIVLSVVMKNLK